MDTLQFLTAVLPPEGVWYFVATPKPGHSRAWNHTACQSVAELAQKIAHFESGKSDVYYAMAGYAEPFVNTTATDEKTGKVETRKRYRTKGNVKLVKAFWLDLDIGPHEEAKAPKYASQAEAAIALGTFLKTTGLPRPMLVSSGYGLHAYWPLTVPLMPGQWRATALQLKALVHAAGILADPSRTADEASVLRPVGTVNKKVKGGVQANPPVELVSPKDPALIVYTDPNEFHQTILAGQKLYGIVPEMTDKSEKLKANPADMVVPVTFLKTSAHKIAERCQQIRSFKETGGISEPHWYRSLGVMRHTIEGEALAHEWSAKHAEYSQEQTEMKLTQLRDMGPTLCATFKEANPDGCKNCPHATRVSTPVQLGMIVPEAAPVKTVQLVNGEIKEVELPPPPAPFKRGGEEAPGLYAEIDGVPLRFYPYDLYLTQIVRDEGTNEGRFIVRHHLPQDGWLEFDVPLAQLSSPAELLSTLHDSYVHPMDNKWMVVYMDAFVKQIQHTNKIAPLYTQFGWHGDGFLIGRRMLTKRGTYHAGVSSNMSKDLIKSYRTEGTHEGWLDLVRMIDKPNREPMFAMVMMAFGAPIFRHSGAGGVVANFWSPGSGLGKSLGAAIAMGVYGDFEPFSAGSQDTINARIERLGMLSNLPAYLDENTLIPDELISSLIYQISSGRGKDKLRSDSTYREGVTWSTILFTSGNKSLIGRMMKEKLNNEAELMRIFECQVEHKAAANDEELTLLHRQCEKHFGHAGEIYLKYLVSVDQGEVQKGLQDTFDEFGRDSTFVGAERFWYSLIGSCFYGMTLALASGALKLDDPEATYKRMWEWFKEQVRRQRTVARGTKTTSFDLITQYFNAHIADRLVVQENRAGLGEISVIKEPAAHGKLLSEHNWTTGRLRTDQAHLRNHINKNQFSVTEVRNDLIEAGVLIDHGDKDFKATLGRGTKYATGQTRVWEFDAVKLGVLVDKTEGS